MAKSELKTNWTIPTQEGVTFPSEILPVWIVPNVEIENSTKPFVIKPRINIPADKETRAVRIINNLVDPWRNIRDVRPEARLKVVNNMMVIPVLELIGKK
jgi:hypothetical protein